MLELALTSNHAIGQLVSIILPELLVTESWIYQAARIINSAYGIPFLIQYNPNNDAYYTQFDNP